ncbi:MAG: type II toxin-antitoxin system death-on-curing family toxin [Candidatus Thorarchaeota archaeon]
MRYLTFDEILTIHRRMTDVFGGESGILSEAALENCIALPMMSIFGIETSPSIWSKAATLLHCIVTRHPFVDGNKRTAWTSAKIFLLLNNFKLTVDTDDAESTVLEVAKGSIDVEELSKWIETHSVEF